jgi:MFS transporter, PAT family, beta-lactamase induction signal transducer AmpG
MRLPNLLATRKGRIAAFFLMYLTEGLPIGFAMTTVATQLRRQGTGTAEIGAFLGLVLLPWAFKWAYGPFVDLIASRRLGPRRGWILGAQLMMVLTLLALTGLDLSTQLGLFTAVLVLHNVFGAVQDVAVDALAVTTLPAHERAFASGMMFGGQSLGVLVGGGGALLLIGRIGFDASIGVLALIILAVMTLVVLPMREQVVAQADRGAARLGAVAREVAAFLREALRALLGSRLAFAGLLFGLLPISAMALQRGLQANLAVDLGLSNEQIGWLATAGQAATALTCIAGGWLSDRVNLRHATAVYVLLLSLPGLYLMLELQRHGWAPGQAAPAALVTAFFAAVVVYQGLFGFIYGARVALFMGITRPAVAATQFAAYMALTNLSITYSVVWQGYAVQHWGYAATLGLDALVGLSCLAVLPLLRARNP